MDTFLYNKAYCVNNEKSLYDIVGPYLVDLFSVQYKLLSALRFITLVHRAFAQPNVRGMTR